MWLEAPFGEQLRSPRCQFTLPWATFWAVLSMATQRGTGLGPRSSGVREHHPGPADDVLDRRLDCTRRRRLGNRALPGERPRMSRHIAERRGQDRRFHVAGREPRWLVSAVPL